MSSILTCPGCNEAFSLPAGRVARVQCPHCGSEITFQPRVAQVAPEPPRPYVVPVERSGSKLEASATAVSRERQSSGGQRSGAFGQVMGIVGGGVLGTMLGYWLLNYFGGPRYDFLQVPLPLVPHTQSTALAAQGVDPPPAQTAAAVTNQPSAAQPVIAIEPLPAVEVPSRFDRSTGEPSTPDNPFPKFTLDELGMSLAAAHSAAGCQRCRSTGFIQNVAETGQANLGEKRTQGKPQRRVPCEVCGGKPTGKITPEVYARLCHLAQVVTFADIAADDPQLPHHKEAVEQVLLRAAAGRDKQNDLGRLAGFHLDQPPRGSLGILLAGTIQRVERQGEFYATRLVLFGLPKEVTVVSRARPPARPNDKVLIAGSILESPRQKLSGYSGTESVAVWGGLPVKLPVDGP